MGSLGFLNLPDLPGGGLGPNRDETQFSDVGATLPIGGRGTPAPVKAGLITVQSFN
jgi:hypothetical protein